MQAMQPVPDVQVVQSAGQATHTPLTAAVRAGHEVTQLPLAKLYPLAQATQVEVDEHWPQLAGQVMHTPRTLLCPKGQLAILMPVTATLLPM